MWAGIAGRLAGERLPAIALFGAALIVVAVIVSELKTKGQRNTPPGPQETLENELQP